MHTTHNAVARWHFSPWMCIMLLYRKEAEKQWDKNQETVMTKNQSHAIITNDLSSSFYSIYDIYYMMYVRVCVFAAFFLLYGSILVIPCFSQSSWPISFYIQTTLIDWNTMYDERATATLAGIWVEVCHIEGPKVPTHLRRCWCWFYYDAINGEGEVGFTKNHFQSVAHALLPVHTSYQND